MSEAKLVVDTTENTAQMAVWVMVIIVVLTIVFVVVPWVIMFVVWGRYRGNSTWKLSGVILNLLFGPLVSFILWLFRPKPKAASGEQALGGDGEQALGSGSDDEQYM